MKTLRSALAIATLLAVLTLEPTSASAQETTSAPAPEPAEPAEPVLVELGVGGLRQIERIPGSRRVAVLGSELALVDFDGTDPTVVELPGLPARMDVLAGEVWVATRSPNRLVRVDPQTASIVDEISLGTFKPKDVGIGDGVAWIIHDTADGGGSLGKVDLTTEQIEGDLLAAVRNGEGELLPVGRGQVLVVPGSSQLVLGVEADPIEGYTQGLAIARIETGGTLRVEVVREVGWRELQMFSTGDQLSTGWNVFGIDPFQSVRSVGGFQGVIDVGPAFTLHGGLNEASVANRYSFTIGRASDGRDLHLIRGVGPFRDDGVVAPGGDWVLGISRGQGELLVAPVDRRPHLASSSQTIIDPRWGGSVTLRGSGFVGVRRVSVGGIVTPFEVHYPGELTLVIPATARRTARIPVVVTNAFGASDALMLNGPVGGSGVLAYFTVNRLNEVEPDPVWGSLQVQLSCDKGGPLGRPRDYKIPPGEVLILAMKPLSRCDVRGEFRNPPGSSMLLDQVDPDNPYEPLTSFSRPSELVVRHRPVGLRWTADFGPAHGWGLTGILASGQVPAGLGFPVEITCAGEDLGGEIGAGAVLVVTARIRSRCELELLDTLGGTNPRVAYRSSAGPFVVRPGRRLTVAGRAFEVFFLVDFPPGELQYPAAVGSPGEDQSAGMVHVLPINDSSLPTGVGSVPVRRGLLGVPGQPRAGDRFGEAVLVTDLDADGWSDVIIGAPGAAARRRRAGLVFVLYGGPGGVSSRGVQVLRQRGPGDAAPEAGDEFGAALALTDLDRDGYLDLVIGAPGEDIGAVSDAGAVAVFHGSLEGFGQDRPELLWEDGPGVEDRSEANDRFGSVLAGWADELWVGTPDEDLGARTDTGAVTLFPGTELDGEQFFEDEVGGARRAGNRFGAAIAVSSIFHAFGAPGADVEGRVDAGRVFTLEGQPVHGVRGDSAGDRLGSSIVGFVENDGQVGYVIGIPGLDAGGSNDVGALYLNESVLVLVPELRQSGDRLGSTMGLAGFGSTLLMSAPGRDGGAGLVVALGQGTTLLTQNSVGIADVGEPGDGFGDAHDGRSTDLDATDSAWANRWVNRPVALPGALAALAADLSAALPESTPAPGTSSATSRATSASGPR